MRALTKLLSGVAAVAAAGFGTGAADAATAPADAIEQHRAGADGWSDAARERLKAKTQLQEMRLSFTKKKALELNVDPTLQQGINPFTKKALDPATNLFTKKGATDDLTPGLNTFTKKGAIVETTPQIQQDLDGLLLPATPSAE